MLSSVAKNLINLALAKLKLENPTKITIEEATIVSASQNKIEKGYVEIAITPKIVGETYITLTNKFKPEVTKRIRVIVRSE